MSANVTRVEGSSGKDTCCSSCCHPLESTASTTGGCPHIVIAATPCPPCCRAGELLWTRSCPELEWTTRNEARRVSAAGNSYYNSWDWGGEEKRKEKVVNGMLIVHWETQRIYRAIQLQCYRLPSRLFILLWPEKMVVRIIAISMHTYVRKNK